ncbi:MAG: YsnF/AvaK domain-containing protein [bacterium]|nr:YsnF/AvaK domain-containing protein [bacterium]
MAKVVTALYDDFASAQAAVQALMDAGFQRDNISIIANDASNEYASQLQTAGTSSGRTGSEDAVKGGQGAGFGLVVGALVGAGAMLIPGIGPVLAAGPLASALIGGGVGAAAGALTGGATAALVKTGLDEETAGYYAEGIRRGGTLVVAHTSDEEADRAVDILNDYDPVDVHRRAESWRQSGWTGFNESSQPLTSNDVVMERRSYTTNGTTNGGNGSTRNVEDGTTLEVVEEELQVGKREVERGAVRVRSFVTETPVQEQVRLREERVTVDRHPVNRQATEADFRTGEETFEVTEMAEEPIVSKQARVVEEVVVRKDVDERVETISDTVRRKDVEIEGGTAGTTGSTGSNGFEGYSDRFLQHYTSNYGSTGQNYDYYVPAYRYGYMLASSPEYSDYDWTQIESGARSRWEEQNQGTWDRIKDAVQNAWDEVRGRR